MNNHGYLKFILTVLVLVIAFFGYMLVTAVDRVRESNLRILEKLEALPGRIPFPAVVPAGGFPGGVAVSPAEQGSPVANAVFFDPQAETGGRLILATAADTANIRNLSLISFIQRRIIAQTIAQTPDDFLPQMRTSNRYLAYICIKKPESPRNVTMGRYLDRTSA